MARVKRAVNDPSAFTAMVQLAKANLPEDVNAPAEAPAQASA